MGTSVWWPGTANTGQYTGVSSSPVVTAVEIRHHGGEDVLRSALSHAVIWYQSPVHVCIGSRYIATENCCENQTGFMIEILLRDLNERKKWTVLLLRWPKFILINVQNLSQLKKTICFLSVSTIKRLIGGVLFDLNDILWWKGEVVTSDRIKSK